jgi:hypothetical protein
VLGLLAGLQGYRPKAAAEALASLVHRRDLRQTSEALMRWAAAVSALNGEPRGLRPPGRAEGRRVDRRLARPACGDTHPVREGRPGDERILPPREQRELDALPSGLDRERKV